jgi:queuosine precursor transporter
MTVTAPKPVRASGVHQFRSFDMVMAAFVAILLLSNLIGAAKLSTVAGYTFGAGILFFPISYIIGDVLTEVYGYSRARRCVWVGFAALIFMAFMSFVVVGMPPSPGWQCASSGNPMFADVLAKQGSGALCQTTYDSVFGSTWRIVLASVVAFWAGEFVNSFVLAKMKILTQGRMLWSRTIGSTVFGQAVDSALFHRFSGRLGDRGCPESHDDQLGTQSALGSCLDPCDLSGRECAQAPRRC